MSPGRSGDREHGFSLVELLVVIGLVGVLGVAITNVVVSTQRTSNFTNDMRTVMDDGRISIDRMRRELRAARRVLESGSSGSSMRFWLDADQDGVMVPAEQICYAVSGIDGASDRYEVLRWTNATEDCDTPGDDATSVARTLVEPTGVFEYAPEPSADPLAPRTRLVTVRLVLDVRTDAGPSEFTVETIVRLRNVE